jgi:hypothetical protein
MVQTVLDVVFEIEIHDHEQEQHHDRAGVHDHLHHGEELGLKQQIEPGERAEPEHQPQCAGHRIALEHHHQAAAGQQRREGEEQERGHDCIRQ